MNNFLVLLNTETKFLFSTSGSQSSIKKHNEALQSLGVNLAYFSIEDLVSPKIYSSLLRAPFVRGVPLLHNMASSPPLFHFWMRWRH